MSSKPDDSELIDHIGWDLWRALHHWKQEFSQKMVLEGFACFGEARGNLIPLIGRDGIAQMALTAKAGMTKQAVQQQLDDLVEEGIAERIPHPDDARKKIVRLTEKGFRALTVANRVKRAIEQDIEERIGSRKMDGLQQGLAALLEETEDVDG